ncbi:ATP-binding region [Planctomycetes bacterium Pla163]|uniref:ATP-binding region n=1 Tax=Rohdeia mirabilis TaxID=2528008 RepID=A0A518CUL4_9BACT|nr:ATP-binding region [Planctomycetes bacterium Pla163]
MADPDPRPANAPRPILLSWSSGKDSAFALYVLRSDPRFEVRGLLTSVNATHERVAMHAVRRELLRQQAEMAGLPLIEVLIPSPCTNAEYERAMRDALEPQLAAGIEAVAFGDLFLEDVRRYREEKNAGLGLDSVFPLWGRDTTELAREMIAVGQRAILTSVDPKQVPASFAGRAFDEALLGDLPPGADPCGENGEFHTFVRDAPVFSAPIEVRAGEIVERDGFVFADLVPGASAAGGSANL